MPEDRRVILAVDDDEMVLALVELALQDGGFEVRTAASVGEAMAALEHGRAGDVAGLITDINLKDQRGGWEVARQARLLNPSLVVVYISGGDGHEWPARGVPGSILLQKPFAPAQLVAAMGSLLAAPPVRPHPWSMPSQSPDRNGHSSDQSH